MDVWTPSKIDEDSEYIGTIEFQSDDSEYHTFELYQTEDRIVFGGYCNVGFLESGYIEIDVTFSLDENLQDLVEELETVYRDGIQYTNRIVCNERM